MRGQRRSRGGARARRQKSKPPAYPVLTGFTQRQADVLLQASDDMAQTLDNFSPTTQERGQQVVSTMEVINKVKDVYRRIAKVD